MVDHKVYSVVEAELKKNENFEILPKTDILTVPYRFNILFSLYVYGAVNFSVLRKNLKMSAGNLKHHLTKLHENGWITEEVDFADRVRQMIDITPQGKIEFKVYIEKIKELLSKIQ